MLMKRRVKLLIHAWRHLWTWSPAEQISGLGKSFSGLCKRLFLNTFIHNSPLRYIGMLCIRFHMLNSWTGQCLALPIGVDAHVYGYPLDSRTILFETFAINSLICNYFSSFQFWLFQFCELKKNFWH